MRLGEAARTGWRAVASGVVRAMPRRVPSAAILLLTAAVLACIPLTSRIVRIGANIAGEEAAPSMATLPAPALDPVQAPPTAAQTAFFTSIAEIAPEAGPAEAVCPEPAAPREAPQRVTAEVAALAQELKERREKLKQREEEIELRIATMELLKATVDQKAAELAALAETIRAREEEVSAEERERIERVVKVYDAMKAKAVAGIFDQMPLDELVPVAAELREAKLAAIVAEMSPDKGRQLMLRLTKH